ncbi:MAG: flagellar protein [Oscillospiraceae bacterium]|nr:flagellar protein [Oscillospiraceae bacterium]MBQ8377611.1 flagellar protein [Oscillospiraceae bacterium]MBQ8883041.1 flagellar protein [Oscillospiraceae bacterium]
MDINLRRLSTPIITGVPQTSSQIVTESIGTTSFKDVLKEQISSASGLNFSKHAVNRVIDRNIDISDEAMERLSEGVKIAEEKGLDDTLILVDQSAYIVSVRNSTVITTISSDELKGNCFTNIDGTVII